MPLNKQACEAFTKFELVLVMLRNRDALRIVISSKVEASKAFSWQDDNLHC
jgi:hypothetical protein